MGKTKQGGPPSLTTLSTGYQKILCPERLALQRCVLAVPTQLGSGPFAGSKQVFSIFKKVNKNLGKKKTE
jgi:hypothetical protein